MSAGALFTYDPNQVSQSLAGIPINDGFAEGSMVEIDRDSDDFEDVVGTSGEVTRSKVNDDRATITIRLMQSAPVNAILSTLRNLDKNTPGGVGVGPYLLRDKSGATLISAEKAWIAKSPKKMFDKTAKELEWKIRCAQLVEFLGGNAGG